MTSTRMCECGCGQEFTPDANGKRRFYSLRCKEAAHKRRRAAAIDAALDASIDRRRPVHDALPFLRCDHRGERSGRCLMSPDCRVPCFEMRASCRCVIGLRVAA